jgi:hypothetical protein
MALFGRGLLLLLAICSLTWLGVLWWWQSRGPDVQEADLVTYLVLLPLTVFLLVLALKWAWKSAAARLPTAQPVTADAGAGAAVTAPADAPGNAQERLRTWQLLHVVLVSPVAEQGQELLDAAEKGEPLPQPDAELVDSAGLPVLTVRAKDIDAEAQSLADELDMLHGSEAWQQQMDNGGLRDGWLRSMALARRSLESQAQWLAQWSQAETALLGQQDDSMPSASRRDRHLLRVLLGVDGHWSVAERTLAEQAMTAWFAELMDKEVERWDAAWDVVSGSSEALWLKADQLILSADRMDQRVWTLVLACSSALDQSLVDDWSAQGYLMSVPQQPRGRIPGEAAAAMLIAPKGWAALPDMDLTVVHMHRPSVSRRSKPIESPGKVDHQVLEAVTLQAMDVATLSAADVTYLVCDADQHSHRATELYGVTLARFPDLDPVQDMRLLAGVGGHAGCASALVLVAAATTWVQKNSRPCVVLSQADAHDRMALVLKPDAVAA